MNTEDMPDLNAAFDPETWTYNPLSHAARWWCERVELPMLEEALAAGDKAAFNTALRTIAMHQIAPPQWLAQAMLDKIEPMKPRMNGLTVEKAQAIARTVQKMQEQGLSLDAIADKLGKSPTTLDDWIKKAREAEAKLDRAADKLP